MAEGTPKNEDLVPKKKRRTSKLDAKGPKQRVGPVVITRRFYNEGHPVLGYRTSGPTLYTSQMQELK